MGIRFTCCLQTRCWTPTRSGCWRNSALWRRRGSGSARVVFGGHQCARRDPAGTRLAAGAETARSGTLRRVILLRRDGREMALQIDTVEQIRWIGASELWAAGTREAVSPHISGSTADLLMLL